MSEMIRYELQNVRDIINNGFEYVIPDRSLNVIESLVKEVGNPDYQKTPIFSVKSRKKKKAIKEISDDEWVTIRQFFFGLVSNLGMSIPVFLKPLLP